MSDGEAGPSRLMGGSVPHLNLPEDLETNDSAREENGQISWTSLQNLPLPERTVRITELLNNEEQLQKISIQDLRDILDRTLAEAGSELADLGDEISGYVKGKDHSSWDDIPPNIQDSIQGVLRTFEDSQLSGTSGIGKQFVESVQRIWRARYHLDTYLEVWPKYSSVHTGPSTAKDSELHKENGSNDGKELEPSSIAGELLDTDAKDIEDIQDIEVDEDPWAETEAEETIDDKPGLNEKEGIEVDNPWAENGYDEHKPADIGKDDSQSQQQGELDQDDEESSPPILLSAFLTQDILDTALFLASSAEIIALRILHERYPGLWKWRFTILEALPGWTSALDLQIQGLLPGIGSDNKEILRSAAHTALVDPLAFLAFLPSNTIASTISNTPHLSVLSADEVSEWYQQHILSLDLIAGVDTQLAWIQHAASLGVPGLDRMGEDLSLLSRLVYDANLSPEELAAWTLSSWQTSSSNDIVSAYLSSPKPNTIVSDVRRLVLPYLYVLESRAERAGHPDPTLVSSHLNDAILSLPLSCALPIFESSKATLPKSQRLVTDDQVVAKLALSSLYGSDTTNQWDIKSRIFECLPVWDLTSTHSNKDDDEELTSTTLDSIAGFVRPSVLQPKPPPAKDLLVFFNPLPFASLSRALDILDVHLESGEALSRWNVPVTLRFLLQSARDTKEQAELAEKMVRRASSTGVNGLNAASVGGMAGRGSGSEILQEEMKWGRLWDDMVKLNGGGDTLLRGAFGMIGGEELMRIYLGGLLRSGKFDIAKRMTHRLQDHHGLTEATLEDVVLATSRELYENAETGNIHTGEMKLAYECLSVAPLSKAITAEKAFIEATSRLGSFKLPSPRGGGSLTPVEIRHTKSKLDLISLILKHNPDSYKHDSLILDLAKSLGGTPSSVEAGLVWGMLASAALQAEDWESAKEYTETLVRLYREVSKKSHRKGGGGSTSSITGVGSAATEPISSLDKLRKVTWETCLDLGKSSDFGDITSKLLFLGTALEFCPASEIPDILQTWRSIESGSLKLANAAKRRRIKNLAKGNPIPSGSSQSTGGYGDDLARVTSRGSTGTAGTIRSPRTSLDYRPNFISTGTDGADRMLGSRTAAKAAKYALDFGERWRGGTVSTPAQNASPTLPDFGGVGAFAPVSVVRSAFGAAAEGLAKTTRSGSNASNQGGIPPTRGSVGGGEGIARPGSAASWRSGTTDEGRRSGELGSADRASFNLNMEDAERVRRGVRRGIVKGVGWLLGAEGGEI